MGKGIADPVHGTIGLSNAEVAVIDTPIFQRLRNVKQLGLTDLVFPSAGYSRFSHSLGVCHMTGRLLASLNRDLSETERDTYRMAALLHDIGHYPFSHAMEDAIEDYYRQRLIASTGGTPESADDLFRSAKTLRHESVGKAILLGDSELRTVLGGQGFDPTELYKIFTREHPPRFSNLVSSDLDADRMDFLLRTAHHTGLPYGSHDINYILSQMRLDTDDRICITPKALKTADHFLLGRFFEYQQVAFNKVVVGLELVLKDVLKDLLRDSMLQCSAEDIKARIGAGDWVAFDEPEVVRLIREYEVSGSDPNGQLRCSALLRRRPPKLVAMVEQLGDRDKANEFLLQKRLVEDHIPRWADRFGLAEENWYVWYLGGMVLTKIGSHVPVAALADAESDTDMPNSDDIDQAVRVIGPDGSSKPVMAHPSSMMSVLAGKALYALRVYVLVPDERLDVVEQIVEHIHRDLDDIPWL